MVKDIEALSAELQTDSFSDLEILKERHICEPLAWANEGIAAKISRAAQTRGTEDTTAPGKNCPLAAPAIGPHIVSGSAEA